MAEDRLSWRDASRLQLGGASVTLDLNGSGRNCEGAKTQLRRAKGVSGNLYNAGNGGRITLNQAWALLQKIEGISLPAIYGPERAGDVRDSQADITAAVRDLGHSPKYSFEKGMRLTLDWYRRSMRNGNA